MYEMSKAFITFLRNMYIRLCQDTSSDLNMMLDVSSMCRFCLRKGKKAAMIPLFTEDQEEENLSLCGKVMSLALIEEMCDGDGLPAQVCGECVHKVATAYDFKLLCERSDAKLRGYMRNSINIFPPQLSEDSRVKQENCLEEWSSVGISCTIDTNMIHSLKSLSSSQGNICTSCDENAESCTEYIAPEISFSGKHSPLHKNGDCFNIEATELKIDTVETVGRIIDENESRCLSDNNISVLDGEVSLKNESKDSAGQKPPVYIDVENNATQQIIQFGKNLNSFVKYRCSFCKKLFVNKAHLTQHLMTHTGERPFVCHMCGVAFARYSNFNRHSLQHTKDESGELRTVQHKGDIAVFECAICLKIFKRKPYLVEHLMSHTGEKPFKCQVCGVNFRRHSNLIRHIKSHSKNDYLTGQHLQKGRRRSKDSRVQHICDVCSKAFRVSGHLKIHMMTHTGEKPFMCDMCGHFFARRTNMVRHARLHTEGSYQPGEIPRRGRRKNNKIFECHICSRPFQHMSRWREHLLSHTGEKPHMCHICGKFFARRTNLIRHSKVHLDAMSDT